MPLALLAVAELARAVAVLRVPWEVMYGEAIIYDHARRLLRHEPLYMPFDRPPYSVAAYTPLYYWIAGALQAAVGPGFLPGRLVSFAAGLAAAALAGCIVRGRTGDRLAGAFAGLVFLTFGMPGIRDYHTWIAFYKEDVLAVALSVGAVAVLSSGQDRPRLVAAGLLAALAFLTKQTTVAPILAGSLWLWRRDRGDAALFALSALLPVLATSAALELTTGAYFANTVSANANPFRWDVLGSNLAVLARFQTAPVLLALLWLVSRSRAEWSDRGGLLALYWAGSMLPLVALAKVGGSYNHWLEFATTTSILATLALWSPTTSRWRVSLAGIVLGVHLSFLAAAVVASLTDVSAVRDAEATQLDPREPEEFARLVDRVRAEPGEVLAEPPDVVVLAGRPILLEPHLFSIFHRQGLWRAEPIVERLCGREISLVVTDHPIEGINPMHVPGFPLWPDPVFDAMRQTMVRESITADRFVYVPREGLAEATGVCLAVAGGPSGRDQGVQPMART